MRVNQCIAAHSYKFCNKPDFNYMSKVFKLSDEQRVPLRNSTHKLKPPFRDSNMEKNCLSSRGPFIWNNLTNEIRSTENYNTFKHRINVEFLGSLDNIRRPNVYRL